MYYTYSYVTDERIGVRHQILGSFHPFSFNGLVSWTWRVDSVLRPNGKQTIASGLVCASIQCCAGGRRWKAHTDTHSKMGLSTLS